MTTPLSSQAPSVEELRGAIDLLVSEERALAVEEADWNRGTATTARWVDLQRAERNTARDALDALLARLSSSLANDAPPAHPDHGGV